MLLSYLRENDPTLQWRQPLATVFVDVSESVRHFPRKYDNNMVVTVHCIRPIYWIDRFLSLTWSNGTQSRKGRVVNYISALLKGSNIHFPKIPSLFWEFADFHEHERKLANTVEPPPFF